MRLKTFISSAFIAVAALTTQASAQISELPGVRELRQNQEQRRHQPRAAPQQPIGVPPAFQQPRHQPPVMHQPRHQPPAYHQPRGFHQPRVVPQFIPVPQFIDREVYVQEPRYYAPQQQYYDDRPVYQPRRAQRRQVCRTVVARDQWGTRHYVKKCRPARRHR